MPRLFTGLEVPQDVGFALSLKRGGLKGARWIEKENYHITLRYIGDVDVDMADEVMSELARFALSEPFSVKLTHLGVFGGKMPRSLYAGVEVTDALVRLHLAQERILQRMGLMPEGRKFTPHVTLARLRGVSALQVADFIHQTSQFAKLEFAAPRFVMFSSRDSMGGGPYLVEERFEFAA